MRLKTGTAPSYDAAGTYGRSKYGNSIFTGNKPSTRYAETVGNISSRSYKSTELPWASSLASSSRYPVSSSKPSTTTSSASFANPAYHSGTSLFASYDVKPTLDQTTHITPSGRSIFDYTSPRTRYDGQLRRTCTAKYMNTGDYLNSTSESQRETKTTRAVPNSDRFTKPSRTSSLKVRPSNYNILDHIAASTIAKLKIGSSPSRNEPDKNSPNDAGEDSKLKLQTTLADPEIQPGGKVKNSLLGPTAFARVESEKGSHSGGATSPYSSSSGLSSSGIVCVSPRSTSSSRRKNSHETDKTSEHNSQDCQDSNHTHSIVDGNNSEADSANDMSQDVGSSWSNEDEEQHTLVSPVSRRLQLLSKELDDNTLASRENLIKTGAILSELRVYDDEREVASDDLSESQISDEELVDSDVKQSASKCKSEFSTDSELQVEHEEGASLSPKRSSSTESSSEVTNFYINLDAHKSPKLQANHGDGSSNSDFKSEGLGQSEEIFSQDDVSTIALLEFSSCVFRMSQFRFNTIGVSRTKDAPPKLLLTVTIREYPSLRLSL